MKSLLYPLASIVVLSIGATSSAYAQIETTRRAPAEASNTIDDDIETLGVNTQKLRAPEVYYRVRAAGLLFATFDANADYEITRAEARAGISRAFSHADKRGNGRLTALDLQAWRIKALGSSDARPANVLFDTDIDGVITKKEFEDQLLYLFDGHDADKNGVITYGELLRETAAPRRREAQEPREREQIFPSSIERREQRRRQGY